MAIDESTVGDTPLVELDLDVAPTVYAKVEWLNFHDQPYGGGSVKSRIAVSMLDAAESRGDLEDHTILEPSSGNTGLALARVGTARGYDVEIVSYEGASGTKMDAIEAAGGTVHTADTYEAMLDEADRRARDSETYYRPNQYANPANPEAHETGTGPELRAQTDGRVTHVVAGVGSGGTVTGVARALPDDVTVVGYEPAEPYHGIDGLKYVRGTRFGTPDVYDVSALDDRLTVSTRDAYEWAHRLRRRYADRRVRVHDPGQYDEALVRDRLRVDGDLLVGGSAGGVVAAVHALDADGRFGADDVVVVPFPDRGDRYRRLPPWGRFVHR